MIHHENSSFACAHCNVFPAVWERSLLKISIDKLEQATSKI